METIIKITTTEEGICNALIEGTEVTAFGSDTLNCLKDLVLKLQLLAVEQEHEQTRIYLTEKRPLAVQLANSLFPLVGDGWFTIYNLKPKLDEPQETIKVKLDFLSQFGLLETEKMNSGIERYKIQLTKEDQKTFLQNQLNNLENRVDTIKVLIKELDQNETVKEQL